MTWPQVAERYLELFQEIRDERSRAPRSTATAFRREQRPRELPPIRLGHLRRMTNGAGLFQHAVYTIPNYAEGYSIDDNARALIAMTYLEELGFTRPRKPASWRRAISPSSTMLSTQRRSVSATSFRSAANGWRMSALRIAMGAHSGR